MPEPVFLYRDDTALKAHAAYREAKAGDAMAAFCLVQDLARPLCERAARQFPRDACYVAPHAVEATGENAIPTILATTIADEAGADVDSAIVQREQVFHTGADPMERLNARATFDGPVRAGGRYVLVDDVTTMGGTLADLADHIQQNGGEVAGLVVIVNAARSGQIVPSSRLSLTLERRFGDVIPALFHIVPAALTHEESRYLIGFRTADELRNRSLKARQATVDRLRAKGLARS